MSSLSLLLCVLCLTTISLANAEQFPELETLPVVDRVFDIPYQGALGIHFSFSGADKMLKVSVDAEVTGSTGDWGTTPPKFDAYAVPLASWDTFSMRSVGEGSVTGITFIDTTESDIISYSRLRFTESCWRSSTNKFPGPGDGSQEWVIVLDNGQFERYVDSPQVHGNTTTPDGAGLEITVHSVEVEEIGDSNACVLPLDEDFENDDETTTSAGTVFLSQYLGFSYYASLKANTTYSVTFERECQESLNCDKNACTPSWSLLEDSSDVVNFEAGGAYSLTNSFGCDVSVGPNQWKDCPIGVCREVTINENEIQGVGIKHQSGEGFSFSWSIVEDPSEDCGSFEEVVCATPAPPVAHVPSSEDTDVGPADETPAPPSADAPSASPSCVAQCREICGEREIDSCSCEGDNVNATCEKDSPISQAASTSIPSSLLLIGTLLCAL